MICTGTLNYQKILGRLKQLSKFLGGDEIPLDGTAAP